MINISLYLPLVIDLVWPTRLIFIAMGEVLCNAFNIEVFSPNERKGSEACIYRDNSMHQGSLFSTVPGSCGKDHPITQTHLATVPNAVAERGFKLFV